MGNIESPGVLLRRHGLHPKKSWGQNFLSDPDVQERIAAAVNPKAGDTVIELGAGLGHLTGQLVGRGARIIAVERDRDLAPVLREELAEKCPELSVVEADAVGFDFSAVSKDAGQRVIVCGNLPYHLSAPILFHALDQWRSIKRLVFLLQKEVVERIVSAPDTENYGLLSVLLQEVADARLAFKVPSGAFVPPPAVDSAVLVADFLPEPRAPISSDALFRRVVKAAFGHRRKTLSNALKQIGSREIIDGALRASEIDPIRRGETLSVEEFARLERAFGAAGVTV